MPDPTSRMHTGMEATSAPGSATQAVGASERLGEFIGPYQLQAVLGEGGFGVVYEAVQTHPVRRQVALKIIKRGMDSREFVARFESERQTLAALDHPHVAKVLGAGATSDGRPYFAMELVKGEPIDRYCDQRQLSIERRLEIFIQVCEAVQHAHDGGVIHRDLKPNNLIIATHDEHPFAKVIDFGIAKATAAEANEGLTQLGEIIGTPAYMSPEQLAGAGNIDTRADVYALGAVLYQLLTGDTPLPAASLRGIPLALAQQRLLQHEPARPSLRLRKDSALCRQRAERCGLEPRSLLRQLHGELDWIVMQALEKDPARRYPGARELAADLRRFLDHTPVLAAPPSLTYRLRKQLWRHRLALLVVGPLVLALVIAVLGNLWQLRQQQRPLAPAEPAIAVLPLRLLGGSDADQLFALGLHDAVLGQLSRLGALRVISREAVMTRVGAGISTRQLAEQLGATWLLQGSIQRAGTRLQIRASLVDAHSESVRWSQPFDAEWSADNLFEIQARITAAIAKQVGAELSHAQQVALDRRATRSTEAYAAYLEGRALARYGNNSLDEIADAITAYQRAIAADPGFAAAHSAKAMAHLALAWGGRQPADNLEAARRALDSASLLDRDSVDTLIAQASYHYRGLLDYPAAEAALARALAREPNNLEAWDLRAANARRDLRLDDAIAGFRRVLELDPLNVPRAGDLAYTLALAGRLSEARAAADRARALAPDHPYVLGAATTVAIWSGDLEAAWQAARRQPVADHAAYDYFRSSYALYTRDSERLAAMLASWPAPRSQPPFHDYFDLMRIFALRQGGQNQVAAPLLNDLLERLHPAPAGPRWSDQQRWVRVAALALAGRQPELLAALADLLSDPPKDRLWLAEEGFALIAALASGGEAEACFDLVDALVSDFGLAQFARLRAAPAFDGLRASARYQALDRRYLAWAAAAP